MPIFLILAIAVAILAVSFALLNAQVVTVSLLFVNYESSLALVLLITLAIGILIGFLGLAPNFFKKRRELSRQKKYIRQLESQVQSLQTPSTTPTSLTTGKSPASKPSPDDIR